MVQREPDEARPRAAGAVPVPAEQQVDINVEAQEEGPPGGAWSVDEGEVEQRGLPGRRNLAATWVVLVVGLVFLAIPVLWATGLVARLLPVASLLPGWVLWLVTIVALSVAALGAWLTYRFASRAP